MENTIFRATKVARSTLNNYTKIMKRAKTSKPYWYSKPDWYTKPYWYSKP